MRALLWLPVALGMGLLAPARCVGSGALEGPVVVVALDGIPFGAAAVAHERGLLPGFSTPGRLVAPFPAMTTVSLCEMLRPLHVAPPRGYELRYYDHGSQRLRGGGLFEYDDEPAPWKAAFHYEQESLVFKTLAYFSPWLAARYEIAQLGDELARTELPLYLAYVGATDPLVHTEGEDGAVAALRELAEELQDVRAERARRGRPPLRVILLSDHGCASAGPGYGRMAGVDMDEVMEGVGLPLRAELRAGQAVAYPLFGLVSFSALHASVELGQERRVDLAREIARVRGVDLVALSEAPGRVLVVGRGGEARIERDPGRDAYAYRVGWGDPLCLGPVVDGLGADGRLTAEGFAADRDWFERTTAHVYPDPLRRLVTAFADIVENPATLLVSYEQGYCSHRPLAWAGLKLTLKDLDGTHGSLDAGSSLGLVASDFGEVPAAIRGSEVLERLVPAEVLACGAPVRREREGGR